MRDEAFADLKQALEDALAFERGERRAPLNLGYQPYFLDNVAAFLLPASLSRCR